MLADISHISQGILLDETRQQIPGNVISLHIDRIAKDYSQMENSLQIRAYFIKLQLIAPAQKKASILVTQTNKQKIGKNRTNIIAFKNCFSPNRYH